MTEQQLEQVQKELAAGDTPEAIAARRGLTRSQLTYDLLVSGKRIVTQVRRFLEDTAPLEAREEAFEKSEYAEGRA